MGMIRSALRVFGLVLFLAPGVASAAGPHVGLVWTFGDEANWGRLANAGGRIDAEAVGNRDFQFVRNLMNSPEALADELRKGPYQDLMLVLGPVDIGTEGFMLEKIDKAFKLLEGKRIARKLTIVLVPKHSYTRPSDTVGTVPPGTRYPEEYFPNDFDKLVKVYAGLFDQSLLVAADVLELHVGTRIPSDMLPDLRKRLRGDARATCPDRTQGVLLDDVYFASTTQTYW